MFFLWSSQKSPQYSVYLADDVRVEDNNISVNAEDHRDEDRHQLEDLVERVEHEGAQIVVEVDQVLLGVVQVQALDPSAHLLQTQIARNMVVMGLLVSRLTLYRHKPT